MTRKNNLLSYPALEPVHRRAAEQIRQHLYFALAGHDAEFEYLHAMIAAEGFEVMQRAQVHVRRVVPLVGQLAGNRHVASQHMEAGATVAEVGEADDTRSEERRVGKEGR